MSSSSTSVEKASAIIPRDKPILLFDGVCNLCNGFVQFVIRHDPQGQFRFAALQSEAGQALLREAQLPTDEISTVVMYEDGAFYTHSDVGLRVLRRLGGLWSPAYALIIIPRFIRDQIYNWVARNRYCWFGRREYCMAPIPELKARFL